MKRIRPRHRREDELVPTDWFDSSPSLWFKYMCTLISPFLCLCFLFMYFFMCVSVCCLDERLEQYQMTKRESAIDIGQYRRLLF